MIKGSWKSVSKPSWEIRGRKYGLWIDCTAQNLNTDLTYFALLYCGETLITTQELPSGATERSCALYAYNYIVEKQCSPLPFDADIVLTHYSTELDRVTRTIPKKKATPPPHNWLLYAAIAGGIGAGIGILASFFEK